MAFKLELAASWELRWGCRLRDPVTSTGPLHGLLGFPHSMVVEFQESKVHGMAFYDLTLDVTEHHFYCTLLVDAVVHIKPVSRKRDREPSIQ